MVKWLHFLKLGGCSKWLQFINLGASNSQILNLVIPRKIIKKRETNPNSITLDNSGLEKEGEGVGYQKWIWKKSRIKPILLGQSQ